MWRCTCSCMVDRTMTCPARSVVNPSSSRRTRNQAAPAGRIDLHADPLFFPSRAFQRAAHRHTPKLRCRYPLRGPWPISIDSWVEVTSPISSRSQSPSRTSAHRTLTGRSPFAAHSPRTSTPTCARTPSWGSATSLGSRASSRAPAPFPRFPARSSIRTPGCAPTLCRPPRTSTNSWAGRSSSPCCGATIPEQGPQGGVTATPPTTLQPHRPPQAPLGRTSPLRLPPHRGRRLPYLHAGRDHLRARNP